jgi:hypothetical protein
MSRAYSRPKSGISTEDGYPDGAKNDKQDQSAHQGPRRVAEEQRQTANQDEKDNRRLTHERDSMTDKPLLGSTLTR